jgi:hypothetical protein
MQHGERQGIVDVVAHVGIEDHRPGGEANVRQQEDCEEDGTHYADQYSAARYSVRNASIGEMRLARSAGIRHAKNAESPRASTDIAVTVALYGLIP